MSDEQADLWNNMDEFLTILTDDNIDYRVGVFSTGSNITDTIGVLKPIVGAANNWVTPYDNNPDALLQQQLAWSSGSIESGIDAMFGAIKYNYDLNTPFWRSRAPLHLITISDEEDQSTYVTPVQLLNAIQEYEVSHSSDVTYSSVITFPAELGGCEDQIATVGYRYMLLTQILGGEVIDICQDDWTDALNDVAYLATDMPYEYFLQQIPDVDTIEVFVEDGPITFAFSEDDWTYDYARNSVVFDGYEPENHQVVVVTYTLMN
jgi:hypothetical protein